MQFRFVLAYVVDQKDPLLNDTAKHKSYCAHNCSTN